MARHGRLDESGASRPTSSRASAGFAEPTRPGAELGSPAGGPVRTCVGCRQRDSQAVMVRFVMSRGVDGTAPGVVADLRRARPGRGAWLHDSARCADLAVKRRAFPRALRTTDDVTSSVSDALGSLAHASGASGRRS